MPIFVPCPTCARHIATTENSCPFCACALPDDLVKRAIPAATRRMSRFAMLTFATTVTAGTAIAACSSDQGNGSQFYGTPPCDPDGSCVQDSGGGAALYGLPGYFDSSTPQDASSFDASDASFVDDGGDAGDDAD